MAESLYEEDTCTYCWGDPRLEERFVPGKLVLLQDGVRFESEKGTLVWPKSNIRTISYSPTFPVDFEEFARTNGVEAAEDVAMSFAMERVPEPALSLKVQDPEDVYPDGFEITILFRTEYAAKVFAKRAEKAFGVSFDSET